jgi:hypothetical protein
LIDYHRGARRVFSNPARRFADCVRRFLDSKNRANQPAATENSGMLNATSLMRIASCLAGCALALILSSAARSQTINISLNVHYTVPSNVNSGGTWEIVAKSSHSGIAGLDLKLANINAASITNQGPRGFVNGTDPAGFSFVEVIGSGVSVRQQPAFATGLEEETAFYGVGTVFMGDVGDVGPDLNTLTGPQDIPWAEGDVFDDITWNTAAMFVSGTFGPNVTPAFVAGTTGRVFLSTPATASTFGPTGPATITTIVRTNFEEIGADYNLDTVVDAADYAVWRKGIKLADGDGDNVVDEDDYDLWVEQFGETTGPGAGGGGVSGAPVPEPAGFGMMVFGLLTAYLSRRRRLVLVVCENSIRRMSLR